MSLAAAAAAAATVAGPAGAAQVGSAAPSDVLIDVSMHDQVMRRRVAFVSAAGHLVPEDNNRCDDVFVRTGLLSVPSLPSMPARPELW